MNIPRAAFSFGYTYRGFEPSLLLAFQLDKLAASAEGPKKPEPEIPVPDKGEPGPNIKPELPDMPKVSETEAPRPGPEVGPHPDVVEVPNLPDMPEVSVPPRDLPGSFLH